MSLYRVALVVAHLDWVDFGFGCWITLPSQYSYFPTPSWPSRNWQVLDWQKYGQPNLGVRQRSAESPCRDLPESKRGRLLQPPQEAVAVHLLAGEHMIRRRSALWRRRLRPSPPISHQTPPPPLPEARRSLAEPEARSGNPNTGWHIRLWRTSRQHQNNSSVLA